MTKRKEPGWFSLKLIIGCGAVGFLLFLVVNKVWP